MSKTLKRLEKNISFIDKELDRLSAIFAFMEYDIEDTDKNIEFYVESEDKEFALHVLKSLQDNIGI